MGILMRVSAKKTYPMDQAHYRIKKGINKKANGRKEITSLYNYQLQMNISMKEIGKMDFKMGGELKLI